jgi:hypothetical protein
MLLNGYFACQTALDTDGSTASGDCGTTSWGNILLHKAQIGLYGSRPTAESDWVNAGTVANVSWGPIVVAPQATTNLFCDSSDPFARSKTFTATSWVTDP